MDVLRVLEPYVPRNVTAADLIEVMKAFGSDKYRTDAVSVLVHKLATSKDADAILDTLNTQTYKADCFEMML